MTITSFLTKLWLDIASFFKKLPADLQQAAHIAIYITEGMKTIVDSPAMDIITALIPGNTDDEILTLLRTRLPAIVDELRLVDKTLSDAPGEEKVADAAKAIQSMSGDIQSAFLHDLGVLIAREILIIKSNGLSWSDAVYIIEWYYQNKFKPLQVSKAA